MAYLSRYFDDPEQKTENEGDQPQTSAPVTPAYGSLKTYGGGDGQVSGTVGGKPQAPTPGQATSSPNAVDKFINFDQYFNANGDAARKSAGDLTGKLARQGESAKNAIDAGTADFNQSVEDNTIKYRPTEGAFQEATVAWGGNPTPVSIDQARQNATATYNGPSSLVEQQNYANLEDGAHKAQTAVNLTKSQSGLQSLVQDQFGVRGAGNSRLDAGLLGAAGREQFAGVRDRFGNLDQYLSGAVDQSINTANTGRANTAKTAGQFADDVATYDTQRAADQKRQDDAANSAQQQKDWESGYAQFMAPSAATTVRRVGNYLDPTHWVENLTGFRGLNNLATDFEESGGGMYGEGKLIGPALSGMDGKEGMPDSAKVELQDAFGELEQRIGRADAARLFGSLSPQELRSLSHSDIKHIRSFLGARGRELGISAFGKGK